MSRRATSVAVQVRQPDVHQDHVGLLRGRERRAPRAPVAASIVRNPAARSTSRASFAFRSLSSTIRTSGSDCPVMATEAVGHMLITVPIRLVLAEDHYLVREGIRRLLETQPDLEVAAACGDLDCAARSRRRREPGCRRHRHPHAAHRRRRGHPGRSPAPRDASGARRRRAQPVRASRATRSRCSRAARRDAPIC